jgi:hypothetical protein
MSPETPLSAWSSPVEPVLPLHLAASRVRILEGAGRSLAVATPLGGMTRCSVVLNTIDHPGRGHVYRADCPAGTRLRVQVLIPSLAAGRALNPAVAVLAQGAPASNNSLKLPVSVPAGYSAQVAAPAKTQPQTHTDALTGATFAVGRTIDTRTLVGGRVYVVVWSPDNLMGKYALQVGYAPVHEWGQWLLAPWIWWQVRGWFGLGRTAAYVVLAAALLLVTLIALQGRRRQRRTATARVAGRETR